MGERRGRWKSVCVRRRKLGLTQVRHEPPSDGGELLYVSVVLEEQFSVTERVAILL